MEYIPGIAAERQRELKERAARLAATEKAKTYTMDRKATILEALDALQKSERLKKEPFKASAYAKAISSLKNVPKIDSIKDIEGVAGIGKQIKIKISDILETGISASAERAKANISPLLNVYGIGPTKANELIELGIKTIDDLKENPKLLTDAQKAGLKLNDCHVRRIPREEINQHLRDIKDSIEGDLHVEIAGSYRRRASDSGDIDVLVTGNRRDFESLIEKLVDDGYITDILSGKKVKHKVLAIARIPRHPHRRVDFQFTEPSEFPFAILYFTGSDQFNIWMRKKALEKGYTLNEKGITKNGDRVDESFKTEKDIFDFLGLEYVEPQNRQLRGGNRTRKVLRPRSRR